MRDDKLIMRELHEYRERTAKEMEGMSAEERVALIQERAEKVRQRYGLRLRERIRSR